MQKNYLIAGGSSGIGLAMVQQLLAENHMVWLLSRGNQPIPSHPNLTAITVDLTQSELPTTAFPEVLDGVAYCPGSIRLKPFRSIKPTQFQEDFEVNVLGAVRVLQACHRALKKAENPGVVLFSTVAVNQGMPFHASIAAAKGAIEGLTRSLAAEWAPQIRVNCVAPSLTDTPLAAALLSTPEKREKSALRHPLKKIGQAMDVASLACFLLSDKGGWISGQVIGVDGGMASLRV